MRLRAMYTSSMETITEFIGFCRQGLHGTGLQSAGLPLALFLAGLAGSLVHCISMCGPFVLGQVIADSERTTGNYDEWQRLAGAAPSLEEALFFSLASYTTAGTATVHLTPDWRLLGACEALAGFLLIGWSTAYLVDKLRKLGE